MLHAGALRGQDATGVINVTNEGDFYIMKEASPSPYFLYNYVGSDADKVMYAKGSAVIGHNRAKTIGENKDENAHPFVVDDCFAMVHNGTLRQHKELADTSVDSEALAIVIKQAFDQDNWQAALEETLGKVKGAYACVWYDQKRNQIGMVRNKERPLSLLETDDGVVFCSEAAMGVWIATRNGAKVTNIVPVPEDTLITFDLEKGGAVYDQTPLTLKLPIKHHGKPTSTGTTMDIKQTVQNLFKKAKHGDVSKNEYKRFRNKLMGKELIFTADDFVEVDLFKENNSKIIIMGESKNGSYDLLEFKHLIKTTIDLADYTIDSFALTNDVEFIGTVVNLEYRPDYKSIEITLAKSRIFPQPILIH